MPHWLSHKLLRLLGVITVTAIIGFLLLPALVVTLAAFNGRAILSFPPETWSWRWFIKAIEYQDFQLGFRNGLIVTAWASSIALVVGAADRVAHPREISMPSSHQRSVPICLAGISRSTLCSNISALARIYSVRLPTSHQ